MNVIIFISIAGITVGVAALLIVLSVFNGFSGIVTKVLVGFDPHIRIETAGGFDSLDYTTIDKTVHAFPQVTATAPFVSGKALIVTKNRNVVVYIRGVDEKKVEFVSGLKLNIVMGELKLNDSSKIGGMVIGLTLAERLGCLIGEDITVISPSDFTS
ncbi:MAG: ABC transporter permease, partial [Ignavibacteriae bacterium]|nr:ABC transporter permease [Ignavibacteriota bacterium]